MEIAVTESQPPHSDQRLASFPNSDSDRESCNSNQQPVLKEDFGKEIDVVLVSK